MTPHPFLEDNLSTTFLSVDKVGIRLWSLQYLKGLVCLLESLASLKIKFYTKLISWGIIIKPLIGTVSLRHIETSQHLQNWQKNQFVAYKSLIYSDV